MRAFGKVPDILTVPVPVLPSVIEAGAVTVKLSVSLSETVIKPLAPVQPTTEALMVVVCVPSIRLSSTGVTKNVAESASAGITTVLGTAAAEGSLEVRLTVTGVLPVTERESVARTAPAPSAVFAGRVNESVFDSLSSMTTDVVPEAIPDAVAVITDS